jgi:tRNA pseudouridine55 synthase
MPSAQLFPDPPSPANADFGETGYAMDGILLVDKPAGPTSHDVVARMRATTGERRIGHTGTLDPMATGLLVLVLGKATRLSNYLTGSEKSYRAVVRLGWSTDTDDALGQRKPSPADAPAADLPEDTLIIRALDRFRGEFDQVPPQHSAKKVGGERAYDLARKATVVELRAVPVTVSSLDLIRREGDLVTLAVTGSAGFYVRALARDLGEALGCGAHLAELRRVGAGRFGIDDAIPMAEAERLGRDVEARLISPADALSELPSVVVTARGLTRAQHGNPLSPEHLEGRWLPPAGGKPTRILDAQGTLVALAHARGGALHPNLVLS